jgi:hypothetical protein
MEEMDVADERHYRAIFSAVIVGHGSFQSTSQTDSNLKLLPAITRKIDNVYWNEYLKKKSKENPKKTKNAFIQTEPLGEFTRKQKQTSSPINITEYKQNFIENVKMTFFIRSCPQEYICINRKDIELGPSDLALKEAFFKGIQRNMNVILLQNCLRLLEIFFIANQFKDAYTKYGLPFDLDTFNTYFIEDVPQEKIHYLNIVYSRINQINSDFNNIYHSLTQLFLGTSFQSKLIEKRKMVDEFIKLFIQFEMDDITCAKFQEFKPSENTQLKTYFFHENEYDGLYLYDIESDYKIHIHPNMTPLELENFKQIANAIYSRNKSRHSEYDTFELFLLNHLIDLIADNTKYNTEIISSEGVTMLLTLLNIRNVSLDLTCSILGDNEGLDARDYMEEEEEYKHGRGVRKTNKNKQKKNLKKKNTKRKKTKRRKLTYA